MKINTKDLLNDQMEYLMDLPSNILIQYLDERYDRRDVDDILEPIALRYGISPVPTDENDEDYALGLRQVLEHSLAKQDELYLIHEDIAEAAAYMYVEQFQ